MIFGIILGFILEPYLGSIKMMIFYFISGIGGTLFAATYSDLYAVGPEPAILGMTAGLIGWFIFNWN